MAIQIQAAQRLLAAEADEATAKTLLTKFGFKGLTLKESKNDVISFNYKSYDEAKVEKSLGKPKSEGESIRYNVATPGGGGGVVAIWPKQMKVTLKNTKRGQSED